MNPEDFGLESSAFEDISQEDVLEVYKQWLQYLPGNAWDNVQ